MKKSQLRNIIKESIKELMTEQNKQNKQSHDVIGTPPKTQSGINQNTSKQPQTNNGAYVVVNFCDDSYSNPYGIAHMAYTVCMTVDGGQLAQIGQTIDFGASQLGSMPNPFGTMVKIQQVYPNHPYCSNPGQPAFDHATLTPGCPSGCGTCTPSDWPNMQSWITQWTSLPNFTSSNPNQPCTHICQKITQWTANCQNAGPVQANQLACKIAEGQNQSSIHGCNC